MFLPTLIHTHSYTSRITTNDPKKIAQSMIDVLRSKDVGLRFKNSDLIEAMSKAVDLLLATRS